MKKQVCILLFILLLLQLVLAVDIDLKKDTYHPGEVLQAEIYGSFPDGLKISDIGIYKEDKVHKTPAEAELTLDNDKYLYYAVLPFIDGNFSLKIENTRYYSGFETIEDTIIKEFQIEKTTSPYLSINKGFIITSEEFSIKIKSINSRQDINADFEATGESDSFKLSTGLERTLRYSIEGIENFTKSNLNINDYDIPVFVYPGEDVEKKSNKTFEYFLDEYLTFYPNKLNATILADKDYVLNLRLKNEGDQSFEDFEISFEPDYGFSADIDEIETIRPNQTIEIEITANLAEDTEASLILSNETETMVLPIYISITLEQEDVEIDTGGLEESCADLGGYICASGQECDGNRQFIEGQYCCIGVCKEAGGGKGFLWGIVILIILGSLGYYIYLKVKQGKLPSPKELLKKRSEKYKKRITPEKPQIEVRKKLTRN